MFIFLLLYKYLKDVLREKYHAVKGSFSGARGTSLGGPSGMEL